MAPTYAEFLKANGATEDEIKVMDVGPARRAYDAMQSKLEAESSARTAKEAELAKYDEWYQTQALPEYKAMEKASIQNAGEAARYKAMVDKAREQGLIDVADDAAAKAAAAATTPAAPAGFDPKNYPTWQDVTTIAEKEGEAIAIASDIAFEHRQLFPDKPLNFREMRRAAVAAKKPVEQFWMEQFGVAAARTARADAERKSHDDALIKQGRDAAVKELADKYGNPDVRPAMPSTSPFAARPDGGRDKSPWEVSDRSSERVQRISQKLTQESLKN